MKTALITTTINNPTVLKLYRKLGPEVKFFIAGDEKTPHTEVAQLCGALQHAEYLAPYQQEDRGYKCSDLIGWNCVERRNIALLEAVKSGAHVIITVDDDNLAIDPLYFTRMLDCFGISTTFTGLEASSPTGWFDPGALLVPQTKHRGFPIGIKSEPVFEPVIGARVGVIQGLCLGDPDIDSVTRIALAPNIHSVSELARAGIVVDPRKTKTVWNTQNTAFIRELAPAFFQPIGVGRYSDIYASLVCQKVMRSRGLCAHYGQPFVFQQRNKHNLITDLKWEISGMENVELCAQWLDAISLPGESVLGDVRFIWDVTSGVMPLEAHEAALAFCDDMESIL